jgi:branched-chain amino acid transport system permease protein
MAASLDISFLTVQVLSALRQAAFLFLISSGLTLIFGVLNILNFAHGSLYMLGAYFIYFLATQVAGLGGFLAVLIAAPLGVALVGVIIEAGLLRRIYRRRDLPAPAHTPSSSSSTTWRRSSSARSSSRS